MPDRRFAADGMVGVSGACVVLSDDVSSNEEVGSKMSSRDVDGGGGVSSNQGGGGIRGSPLDMFDSSRDGGTCVGGDVTCCGMSAGVSCSVEIHGVSVLDGPTVVYHHRGEVAWVPHQLRVWAVEFRVVYQGEE